MPAEVDRFPGFFGKAADLNGVQQRLHTSVQAN
jgi:hypothetical protein